MNTLRWLRVPGDTIFAIGGVLLVLFVLGLAIGHSTRRSKPVELPEPGERVKGPGRTAET
jgi:nitric oxide reductase subunit B